MSNLIIISGTNGVGKSTFGNYLKTHYNTSFINTDEFYKNLFGSLHKYSNEELKAGTIGIRRLQNNYFNKQQNFAVERILSNEKEVNNLIDRAKSHNFKISLVYIGIDTLELSKRRIEQRFKEGGHNVKDDIIKENFNLGIQNFQKICSRVDYIVLYDNSKYGNDKYKKLLDARDGKIHFQAQEQELHAWSKPFIESINTKVIATISINSKLQDFKTKNQNTIKPSSIER
ncbi:MAG: zeta toxin family protein [Campylobacteraceae bacterium]|jgi:predicted ABC-type ATPase|nr:zeta toxin family protein [Campylobacteraceae bacterium]